MSKTKAFGSFHSENVEHMISNANWEPPTDPSDVCVAEVVPWLRLVWQLGRLCF
jgi:hypothetical protein